MARPAIAINRRWRRVGLQMVATGLLVGAVAVLFLLHRHRAVSGLGRLNFHTILPPDGTHLSHLLAARPPGSPAHRRIQKYVEAHFTAIGWHFETDRFQERTVLGPVEFTNLIATADPLAPQRIVLAAHYDSKRVVAESDDQEVEGFLGATDSAWSCAFLLELAASLPSLVARPHSTTLQIVLFDGEEALRDWSDTDSLYGSRHLARKWAASPLNHHNLGQIKYMMLLDLLGAPRPRLYSFFPQTQLYYHKLIEIERTLRHQGQLRTTAEPGGGGIFVATSPIPGVYNGSYTLGDDHVPFAQRHVPIIHLIPYPFPDVWHRLADDMTALDPDTCHDLALLIRTFVVLELTAPAVPLK